VFTPKKSLFSLSRRTVLGVMAAATLGLTGPAVAQQQWPSAKPIRIVVGFAPGGTTEASEAKLDSKHQSTKIRIICYKSTYYFLFLYQKFIFL